MAQNYLGQRIAHQQDVNAGILQQGGGGGVVTSQHGYAFALLLEFHQRS